MVQTMEMAIDRRADINTRNNEGPTPMYAAVAGEQNHSTIPMLLKSFTIHPDLWEWKDSSELILEPGRSRERGSTTSAASVTATPSMISRRVLRWAAAGPGPHKYTLNTEISCTFVNTFQTSATPKLPVSRTKTTAFHNSDDTPLVSGASFATP